MDWQEWKKSTDTKWECTCDFLRTHGKLISDLQEQVAKLEVRVCELEDAKPEEVDYRCVAYTKDTHGNQSQCEGPEGHDGSHWHGATLWPNN